MRIDSDLYMKQSLVSLPYIALGRRRAKAPSCYMRCRKDELSTYRLVP